MPDHRLHVFHEGQRGLTQANHPGASGHKLPQPRANADLGIGFPF